MLYDILVKKSIIEEGVCIMAKILIVDDEPRIRELIREHLQYSGYICEEAADGTAALTQLSGGASIWSFWTDDAVAAAEYMQGTKPACVLAENSGVKSQTFW